VYIDNTVPQNDPLQDADFRRAGHRLRYRIIRSHHRFGPLSPISDGNGCLEILMTDAVNSLTPDCTNGRVLDTSFGSDSPQYPNSNHGEVFYTLVPAPAHGTARRSPGAPR
jgi:hypothetical protein